MNTSKLDIQPIKEIESVSFIFEPNRIEISENLITVFNFLSGIEKEISTLLDTDKRSAAISRQYLELVDFTKFLADKLRQNSIEFSYQFPESPITIAEKIKIERPLRSEMIVLFAHLEVLTCLNIAFDHKTIDENEIKRLNIKSNAGTEFIKNFCLNPRNEWGIKNPVRLRRIKIKDFRKLRNSLTHFFSMSKGIAIYHNVLGTKARELEKIVNYSVSLLSPEDLNQIINGAAKLLMAKWSEECKKFNMGEENDFRKKMLCVRDVINLHGAKLINNNQINVSGF